MGWLILEIMILITASVAIGVGVGGLAANGFSAARLGTTLVTLPKASNFLAVSQHPTVPIPLEPTNLPMPLSAIGVSCGPLLDPVPEAISHLEEGDPTTRVEDRVAGDPPTVVSESTADVEKVGDALKMPPLLAEPRNQTPDDLKHIKGIGPSIEVKLYGIGVYHIDQIAEWSQAESGWINDKLALMGRIERDSWVNSARTLLKLRNAPSLPTDVAES